jgi:hypothetical protein
LVAFCFARAGYFEKVVTDAAGDHPIVFELSRSQQGFQYCLLFAHDSLLSKMGTICTVPSAHADKTSHFNFAVYPPRFAPHG